jgi:hypothetical protein
MTSGLAASIGTTFPFRSTHRHRPERARNNFMQLVAKGKFLRYLIFATGCKNGSQIRLSQI